MMYLKFSRDYKITRTLFYYNSKNCLFFHSFYFQTKSREIIFIDKRDASEWVCDIYLITEKLCFYETIIHMRLCVVVKYAGMTGYQDEHTHAPACQKSFDGNISRQNMSIRYQPGYRDLNNDSLMLSLIFENKKIVWGGVFTTNLYLLRDPISTGC